MLTLQEIRSSTRKELLHELTAAQKKLLELRMGVHTKHQKDTSLVKKQKRFVGQLMTVLRDMDHEEKVKKATVID